MASWSARSVFRVLYRGMHPPCPKAFSKVWCSSTPNVSAPGLGLFMVLSVAPSARSAGLSRCRPLLTGFAPFLAPALTPASSTVLFKLLAGCDAESIPRTKFSTAGLNKQKHIGVGAVDDKALRVVRLCGGLCGFTLIFVWRVSESSMRLVADARKCCRPARRAVTAGRAG